MQQLSTLTLLTHQQQMLERITSQLSALESHCVQPAPPVQSSESAIFEFAFTPLSKQPAFRDARRWSRDDSARDMG